MKQNKILLMGLFLISIMFFTACSPNTGDIDSETSDSETSDSETSDSETSDSETSDSETSDVPLPGIN